MLLAWQASQIAILADHVSIDRITVTSLDGSNHNAKSLGILIHRTAFTLLSGFAVSLQVTIHKSIANALVLCEKIHAAAMS